MNDEPVGSVPAHELNPCPMNNEPMASGSAHEDLLHRRIVPNWHSYFGKEFFVAVIASILTLAGAQWLQTREETLRKQAILRIVYSTVHNDLRYTILGTEAFRNAVLRKN